MKRALLKVSLLLLLVLVPLVAVGGQNVWSLDENDGAAIYWGFSSDSTGDWKLAYEPGASPDGWYVFGDQNASGFADSMALAGTLSGGLALPDASAGPLWSAVSGLSYPSWTGIAGGGSVATSGAAGDGSLAGSTNIVQAGILAGGIANSGAAIWYCVLPAALLVALVIWGYRKFRKASR